MLCSEKLSNYPWLSFLVTLQTVLPGTLLAESGLGLIQWIYGFFPSRACLYLLFLERHIAFFFETFTWVSTSRGGNVRSRDINQRGNFGSNLHKMKPRSEKLSCLRRIKNGEKLAESCMHAGGKNSTRKWIIARRTLWLPSLRSERSPNFNGILFTRTESGESDSSPLAPWR